MFHGHDIARVFRFRLVVMAAAMLVSSLVATWCFELMGAVATQLGCGLLILAVGVVGHFICRRRIERRSGAADADLRQGRIAPVSNRTSPRSPLAGNTVY